MKILKPELLDPKNVGLFQKEAEILKYLDHDNICQFYQYERWLEIVLPSGESKHSAVIVQEHLEGGDLFDFISQTGAMSEPTARFFFRQIWSALLELQMKGISHRDLKWENIMLDSDYNLKLIDFGYASVFNKASTILGKVYFYYLLGTAAYCAPEIKNSESYTGSSVDIFNIGVILFWLLCRRSPFYLSPEDDDFYDKIVKNQAKHFWNEHYKNGLDVINELSEEVKSLITLWLQPDPLKRPSLSEIQQHEWFQEVIPTKDEVVEELK